MEWFGEDWGSRILRSIPRVPAPIGEPCGWCDEVFVEGDQGFTMPCIGETVTTIAYHRECHIRQIVGSVGHQNKQCSCFGGINEDPEGLTKREAAQAAMTLFEETLHGR